MSNSDTSKRWDPWDEGDHERVSSERLADSERLFDEPVEPAEPVAEDEPPPSGRRRSSRPAPAPPVPELVDPRHSRSWYQAFYRRFRDLVWSKLQDEDISPDSAEGVHLEIMLTAHDWIAKQGELPDNPPALLSKMTRNQLRNYRRVAGHRPVYDREADLDAMPCDRSNPEQAMIDQEEGRFVEEIFDAMPKDSAALMRWIDVDGNPNVDVAEVLGISYEAVKSRHRRARKDFEETAKRLHRGGGR